MVSGRKKPEEVVASLIKRGETVLYWSGEYDADHIETKLSKNLSYFIKAISIVMLIALVLFSSQSLFWLNGILFILMFVCLFSNAIYAEFNKEWFHSVIVTDQRVFLRYQGVINGSDITALESGFGMNGAVTNVIKTRLGSEFVLPVIDTKKVSGLIYQNFLAKP